MDRPPIPPNKKASDGIAAPKSIAEIPFYLIKKIKNFLTHFFYVIALVWQAAPLLLIFMSLCCIVDGVFPVIGAYITRDLVNSISDLIISYNGTGAVIDAYEAFKPIIFIFILQFIFFIARAVFSRLNVTATALAGELVSNHIKLKIIKKAKTVDQSSFDRPEFYEKLENANREAGMRPIGILSSSFTVISSAISIVSFIVILAGLSPFAPIIMIAASLPGAFVNYYFRKRSFRYMRHHSKERRQMNYYSGLMVNKDQAKEIKILGLGDTFVEKYENVFKKYYKGLKRIILKEGVMRTLVSVLMALANCGLFAYVAYSVVTGDGKIGDYSLYTGALSSVSNYVSALVTATAAIYEGTLFIDNMIAFMNEKSEIVACSDEPAVIKRGAPHTLELRGVSFSYPESEKFVLKNINLTLKSGESTVIVGLNGAGKTTLIKLILRLYDPTEGEIFLDGRPLKDYEPKDYYYMFGIIFQDFGKYSETVSENIEFGDIGREKSEENVVISAENAAADGFISDLPEKYQTPLTRLFEEDGIELSGGQWQKLSVARAFYKDSDILIMDEPTASLDALAEQEIFSRFETLSKGKISIFISHRLSSATTADRIVVLNNGEIAEMGSHKELMECDGAYRMLFTTQAHRYFSEK
ncbi:MAG: ABC transporter ATP-binding protein [Clostridia bacterium]|nr:ABC transporter ATP-binding protein [Clostridia bacterium]